ncbi:MAG TPA: hypothetical protein VGJ55_04180 [Pyrinomonadaceae bacterium]
MTILRSDRRETRESGSSEIRRPQTIIGGIELRRGQLAGLVIDTRTGKPIPAQLFLLSVSVALF